MRFASGLHKAIVAMIVAISSPSIVCEAADILLVGAPSPTNTRTDTLAQAGFGFFINSPIQVNKLGFWVSPADSGNTGVLAVSHTVALLHYVPGIPNRVEELAQVTIAAGSTGDSNHYAWAILSTPVTLTDTSQNADYYSLVATQGTDTWGPFTGSNTFASLGSPYTTLTGNGIWSTTSLPGVGNSLISSSYAPSANGGFAGPNMSFIPVPEPSTYILGTIATGIMAILARKRGFKKS